LRQWIVRSKAVDLKKKTSTTAKDESKLKDKTIVQRDSILLIIAHFLDFSKAEGKVETDDDKKLI
jgi:hypothetical protein